jgi:hypothetical protein
MFLIPWNHFFRTQVVELNVHTENSLPVVFRRGDELDAARAPPKLTPLLAYFKLNNEVLNAKERERLAGLTFVRIPEFYMIDKDTREWRKKKHCNKPTIGCLYAVSPKDRERYFLRALLLKRKCPLSYKDLRTVNGVPYDTFREAAVVLGLVRGDEEYRQYEVMILGNVVSLILFPQHSARGERGIQSVCHANVVCHVGPSLLPSRSSSSF